ncbi:MAG: ribonuclease HII [Treponema sp.]|jgi:ribonuclease HII|nr:ribonuclease HII [Treponema sp.]
MPETIFSCGIDEAGRGPLAGPVCAASVILGDNFPRDLLNALNDSKKLKVEKREILRQQICDAAFAWGIGWANHTEIDSINILQASLLAMKRAYQEMLKTAALKQSLTSGATISAIADGNFAPEGIPLCKAMVKADAQIPEVMAASILAKTARDNHMIKMSLLHPQYGYEKHKGYPTKAHKEMIRLHGPSPIQRMTFRAD